MKRRTPFPWTDRIAVAGALAACGVPIIVGCGSDGRDPTTSTTFSHVDAGEPTKGDATTDVSWRSSPNAGDSATDDVTVTAKEAAGEAGQEMYDAGPTTVASGPEASTVMEDAPIGPQACGLADCPPGGPCADLTVDRSDLLASIIISQRTFSPTDCAVAEGCITTTGTRTLLRFDTGTVNTGTADVVIGDPTQNACFTFSQCHQHYHFRGVGHYTLYQSDGVTVAATGHKQGFCLEDVDPAPDLSPTPPGTTMKYSCTNQGLQVGWEDIYPNDIDCQWIDITGVPAGDYILSVVINAGHDLPESNYDNNEERVPVTVQ